MHFIVLNKNIELQRKPSIKLIEYIFFKNENSQDIPFKKEEYVVGEEIVDIWGRSWILYEEQMVKNAF